MRTTTLAVGVRARLAAALGALLALTACQQAQQEEPAGTAPPPPVVRHDVEELARMFPALGTPVSASWIRWDNGDQSAVKVVWIDAVVQVTPATMDELVSGHASEDRGQHPAVQKVLEPDVPPGPFRTGVDLNIAFDGDRISTRVFLDEQRDTVVLQSWKMGRGGS